MYKFGLILFSLLPCFYTAEVTIQQGKLTGIPHKSRNGNEFYAFLSIPFAKPPTGRLRFEPPQPPDSWTGTRNASRFPSPCIQKNIFAIASQPNIMGSEDCLYLNVYTPAEKTTPLPVMVYIPGGAFNKGSAALYHPSYLLDYPVIVVTIQYRLHVLGFLSTGDQILPGNNGMKDQVAALKWVQNNIAAFGGDPNKVTLFGQSSGAASVHYHIHSPLSKGLFHRAISQSGTAQAVWAYTPRSLARQRAQAVGVLTCCPTKSSKALINCLRKLPVQELVHVSEKFYAWNQLPVSSFSITSEPEHDGAFITQNAWYHEAANKVPWIVGINSADGALAAAAYLRNNGTLAAELNKHYKRLLPISLYYGSWIDDDDKIDQISETLKRFYFGDKDIGVETANQIVQLYTDGSFMHDAVEASRSHQNSVYFYYYDHRNNRSYSEILGKYQEDLGVSHGDELISLFSLKRFFSDLTEGDDYHVSNRMVKYWINFAQTGNPNNGPDTWFPAISDDLPYLHITTERDQMKTALLQERYQFWKNLQLKPPAEVVSYQQQEL